MPSTLEKLEWHIAFGLSVRMYVRVPVMQDISKCILITVFIFGILIGAEDKIT